MSKIQDYLNKIATAVYGKDVRQSIVDAISQCYRDGKSGSIDLEAREEMELLSARVENLTANSEISTEGNAELIDVRVGADGTTYETAGTAVRTQISDLNDAIPNKATLEGSVLKIQRSEDDTDNDLFMVDLVSIMDSDADVLLGTLPFTVTEENCYLISETEATVTTQIDDLYEREGECLVGSPTDVVWGDDSLTYTAGSNSIGVYTHTVGLERSTTYTLFADMEGAAAGIRILIKTGNTNLFMGNAIVQLNGSGYITFTTPDSFNYINLGFLMSKTGATGTFKNIKILEGTHSEVGNAATFTIKANTEYPADAYIGISLTSDSTVKVYKKNSNGKSESDTGGVIFFGDSILDYSNVAERYAENTGKSVLDCAVGGTRWTPHSQEEYNPYSMCNIADAITGGDFSSQVDGGKNTNFSVLASGNISAYKAIVLEFGTNDFTADRSFGGSDTTTIEGAVKYVLDSITKKYPNIRIVVLSTLQFVSADSGSGTHSHSDGTIWEMNKVIRSVCESDTYCVPFVDMYHAMGENATTRATLTSDGVHLKNPDGAKRYADILTGQLNALGI